MQEEPAVEIEDQEGMDTEREGYNWNSVLSWKAEQERVWVSWDRMKKNWFYVESRRSLIRNNSGE